jgi:Zn-dependent M28 family amino/carboxypeptidase
MLQHQAIVIGAHRDHFGEQAGFEFPGADDNASGTAVMLEVAKQLTEDGKKPKRSILFVSFDGEERGLLGSRLYVDNPARPLDQTVAMINLDHVGTGNGTLTVGITRLDKSIVQQAATQIGLTEKVKLYGYFPGGDHVPFYEMEVPTITAVSAGVHPHFHQPSDTAEEIDPETVRMAARFILSLVNLLANSS